MSDYIQNVWYMAAWEHEITASGLFARTLLGKPWLIYRLGDGTFAMLEDRCPHRFVPLSMGHLDGDVVVCRYHGLGFDKSGTCVRNPFPAPPPEHVRAQSRTVVARHQGLWFWEGDPAAADPALIPDYSFIDTERLTMKRNYLHIKANYELMNDNLLDLSHAEFLHAGSFGVRGALLGGTQTVRQDEDGAIWNNWDMEAVHAPAWAEPMVKPGQKFDQWLHMRWHAPSALALTIGLAHTGTQRRDVVVPVMNTPHIITPETQATSHYFFDHDDTPEAEELMRKAFIGEDEPMLEAAQQALADIDFWDARPAILATDAAAIRARRRLMQLRRAQTDASSASDMQER